MFLGENDCTLFKNRQQILKPLREWRLLFLWGWGGGVADLKETSIDAGVVVDGAVHVVAHDLDH